MSGSQRIGRRRGIVVRDLFIRGDPSRPDDSAAIEAERRHLCEVTGFDIRFLHYDKLATDDPAFCHSKFLEEVDGVRPEFILYRPSSLLPLIHRNIRPEALHTARLFYGPRLIFSFDDASSPFHAAYAAGYAAIGDISVATDGNGAKVSAFAPGKAILDLWPAADPGVFHDDGHERDVDVCFAGSLRRYPDRREMLAALQSLDVPVAVSAGDDNRDVGTYAALLRRSRISLNFSRSPEGAHQLKRRVIESILCGALLFESENGIASRYLTPYRHYVPFGDAADLAAKIRRYLGNDAARRSVVAAAKTHAGSTMTHTHWWKKIIEELDRAWAYEIALRQKDPSRG